MKQLILTGLATEHSFNQGGKESYFLVFNNGAFRVPITEEAAEVVVREMYQGEAQQEQVVQDIPDDEREYVSDEPRDGVDQI